MHGYISGRASIIGQVACLFPRNVLFLDDGFETGCDESRCQICMALERTKRGEADLAFPYLASLSGDLP
jgi:hypothetical protein